jgi:DNA-binding response OmpR family regulator
MQKILLIEDELRIARALQLELEQEGYVVTIKTDGLTGLEVISSHGIWDVIILDMLLPGICGLEVLRRVRLLDDETPIILLSARAAVPDMIHGLDLGANDYLVKPFAIEELFARIRNLFRARRKVECEDVQLTLRADGLVMDLKTRDVYRDHQHIQLTPREFNLLHYLLKFKNEVLTREHIISHVWGYDFIGDTNIVDVYIRYLRHKIDKRFPVKLIHTVRGIGYTLKISD